MWYNILAVICNVHTCTCRYIVTVKLKCVQQLNIIYFYTSLKLKLSQTTTFYCQSIFSSFSSIPSLLEYFSYNFSFMTFLAGPTFAYKNYDDFITGANFTQATNNKVSTI